MTDIHNVYRIMILYMLKKTEFPLTNTQITNFMLERDYTDYFTIQRTLTDLQTAELISAEKTYSNTRYHLTDAGIESLSFFEDKLTEDLKKDILAYCEEHHFELKQENNTIASYYRAPGHGYNVRCQITEGEKSMVDLTLYVSTKEQALAVCDNWNKQSEDVYMTLMDLLIR